MYSSAMIKVRWEMGFERQPTELQACYGDGGSTGTFRKLNPLKALSRHFRLWIFMKNWDSLRGRKESFLIQNLTDPYIPAAPK
jgi:hypothetical protein